MDISRVWLVCSLVLQLYNGLYGPVVVVKVDRANHLGSLKIANLHSDFADSVAANQLHHLLSGGVTCVHFDRWEFDVLRAQGIK